jgi:hypothetical protein
MDPRAASAVTKPQASRPQIAKAQIANAFNAFLLESRISARDPSFWTLRLVEVAVAGPQTLS